EPRLRHTGEGGKTLECGMKAGRFSDRQLACAGKSDDHAIRIPVERPGEEDAAEDEDREQPVAAEGPTEQSENRARADQQRPRFQDVANDEEAPGTNCRPLARARVEASRRPARRSGSSSGATRC